MNETKSLHPLPSALKKSWLKQFIALCVLLSLSFLTKGQVAGPNPPPEVAVRNKVDQSGTVRYYQFTLDDCIKYALDNNDSLKNSAINIQIAEQRVKETVGRGIPNVAFNVSSYKNAIIRPTVITSPVINSFFGTPAPGGPPYVYVLTFGVPWETDLTAEATQLIFDASYLVGLKAAAVIKDLAIKNNIRNRINAIASISKAYYNVLTAKERLKITAADLDRISKNLVDTKALNKAGFGELIDVQRVEVQYNNALADRQTNLNQLLVALSLLKFQIGMPMEFSLDSKGNIAEVNFQSWTDTTSLPYLNRIEYSLQQTQVKASFLTWKNSKAALYPKLSAYADAGESYFGEQLNNEFHKGYLSVQLGLRLSWSIFDGTQTYHRITESRLAYEQSKNDLDNLGKSLQLSVVNSRAAYTNNLINVQNQDRNRKLSQSIYNSAKIKYSSGIGSNLELTDAETDLKNAETNYINALLNTLISKVDLDQALGNINPK